jgi:hypothetical protein
VCPAASEHISEVVELRIGDIVLPLKKLRSGAKSGEPHECVWIGFLKFFGWRVLLAIPNAGVRANLPEKRLKRVTRRSQETEQLFHGALLGLTKIGRNFSSISAFILGTLRIKGMHGAGVLPRIQFDDELFVHDRLHLFP